MSNVVPLSGIPGLSFDSLDSLVYESSPPVRSYH